MSRKYNVYLNDILKSIVNIEEYTKNFTQEDFVKKKLVIDAVIRNLEIIGEAVKSIPKEVIDKYPDVEWKKIVGFRDVMIHAYFGVNLEIVWEIIENKIPELKKCIKDILKNSNKKE